MRAAFNQLMQNSALVAAALNSGMPMPPHFPPGGLHNAHPSVTTPSTSASKNVINTSFMPTSVMRNMTKTASSTNSKFHLFSNLSFRNLGVAGSSISNTPSNLNPQTSNASTGLFERMSPTVRETQSPGISHPSHGQISPQLRLASPGPATKAPSNGNAPSPKSNFF